MFYNSMIYIVPICEIFVLSFAHAVDVLQVFVYKSSNVHR